jgi:hypothetical protein
LIAGALAVLLPEFGLAAPAPNESDFMDALSRLALPRDITLARSNIVRVVLESFRSNEVVKAIVVSPGVIDDLHLINRDAPALKIDARTVADALARLTNCSSSRLEFTNSIVHWRTETERSRPEIVVAAGSPLSASLARGYSLPQVLWIDAHWEKVQPQLKKSLRLSLRPPADADAAWHFERVNIAAAGLNDWEIVRAVAQSTGTRIVIRKRTLTFERPANGPNP